MAVNKKNLLTIQPMRVHDLIHCALM